MGETTMQRSSFAFAAGIVVLLAGVSAAFAAEPEISMRTRTAGDLADLCGAPVTEAGGPERVNFCHGYAQGALVMELKREAAVNKKLICIPSPAPTREATLGEFVKWVRALPKNAALPATDGLFTFLSQRFPCK
jgi:hypothetical protein